MYAQRCQSSETKSQLKTIVLNVNPQSRMSTAPGRKAIVAIATVLSLASVSPYAWALDTEGGPSSDQISSGSSLSSGSSDPNTGSTALDVATVGSAASSGSSDVPLSAGPTLGSTELAQGSLGSSMFEGSSQAAGSSMSSGSSDVTATYPDTTGPIAELRDIRHIRGNLYEFDAYSPAMDRVVTNDLLLPQGGLENTEPRPTFYLMMGADGAAGGLSWYNSSNYEEFFQDKNVQVVTPKGSVSSMQANWYKDDPVNGRHQWTTYMVHELPKLVDEAFHGTGRDAIAGISMSGGPAIQLASFDTDRFAAAGSYSGCPSTSGIVGQIYTYISVLMNGGNPIRMWGWPGNPAWSAQSPVLNLDRLKNTALFVGAAWGVPGPIDASAGSSDRWGMPMLIEGSSYVCSNYFVRRAQSEGLNVDWYPAVYGTHTWPLFEKLMRESWSTIGPAIGVE